MNNITLPGDFLMTAKEVADALGVDPEAIKKHVRELFPDSIRNGVPTLLSEAQVTEIKRHMRPTTEVVGAVTDLEMMQKAAEVVSWAMAKIEAQRRAMADLAPRAAVADRIAGAAGLKTLSEVGKINGLGPRKIFDLLKAKGIIFRGRQGWLPYQEHIDAGRFVVRESTYQDLYEEDHLASQTYVTGKGEVWLARQFFSAEVP